MKTSLYSSSLALLFISACRAAPAQQTLNDGSSLKYGTVYGGQLSYDSSGVIKYPCADPKVAIGTCYSFQVSADPKANLDTNHLDSPRQRNEFRVPWAAAGEKHTYGWKMYLYGSTGTGSTFFHLMQVFDDTTGTPVVTLDAKNGQVGIESQTLCQSQPSSGRGLLGLGGGESSGSSCPSIPLSQFVDRTTLHSMSITYGQQGSITYTVTDAATKQLLLTYSAKGALGSSKTAAKFGTYRATYQGETAVMAGVGDYTHS
ncbi:hypothetical protein EV714DRAFT_268670 [Schizophyllum commune]